MITKMTLTAISNGDLSLQAELYPFVLDPKTSLAIDHNLVKMLQSTKRPRAYQY